METATESTTVESNGKTITNDVTSELASEVPKESHIVSTLEVESIKCAVDNDSKISEANNELENKTDINGAEHKDDEQKNDIDEDTLANLSTEVHASSTSALDTTVDTLDTSLSEQFSQMKIKPSVDSQLKPQEEEIYKWMDNKSNVCIDSEKEIGSTSKEQHNEPEDVNVKKELEKSIEISNSILAGDLTDHSECSVDIDVEISRQNGDAEESSDEKANSTNSDGHMSVEDHDNDEDVEEEEEFHEAEEEKHKTSEGSLGNSTPNRKSSTPAENNIKESSDVTAVTSKVEENSSLTGATKIEDDSNSSATKPRELKSADWADIMLGKDQASDEDQNKNKSETDDSSKNKDDEKKLDLDEDVKNPQYIPKKGVFYEHDDRTQDESAAKKSTASSTKKDESNESKAVSVNRRSNIQEGQNDSSRRNNRRQRADSDRWDHDRFRYDQQKPKNKPETNDSSHDTRSERTPRNQGANRPRGSTNFSGNNMSSDRQQRGQDGQRGRQTRDNNRGARVQNSQQQQQQTQPQQSSSKPSLDRKARRPPRNSGGGGVRSDRDPVTQNKRDPQPNRSRLDSKENKTHDASEDNRHQQQNSQQYYNAGSSFKNRDQTPKQDGNSERTNRIEGRGRRLNSKDRPTSGTVLDEKQKLPPICTVMPPITNWSNNIEDMVKEDASRKDSSSQERQNQTVKSRPEDIWPQNGPSKINYQDGRGIIKSGFDDGRQQQHHFNNRNKGHYHQDQHREENHKSMQFVNRFLYNDRSSSSSNQQQQHSQDWRRTGHYNNHGRQNDYGPIKTQTFENSRLSQQASAANGNKSGPRDAREIIERKQLQSQQNFQTNKLSPSGGVGSPGATPSTGVIAVDQALMQHHQQPQHLQQQPSPSQARSMLQNHQFIPQQQQQPHLIQQQMASHGRQPLLAQGPQQPSHLQSTHSHLPPQGSHSRYQQMQGPRRHLGPASQPPPHPSAIAGQGIVLRSLVDGTHQDPARLTASTAGDLINNPPRPIIKADAYSGSNVASQQQPPHHQQDPIQQQTPQQSSQQAEQQQHSQNHRSMGMAPPQISQGLAGSAAGSHMVPSHMDATGNQASYYSPQSRDSGAPAYHGYMGPGGHSVMDHTSRYHMTSQQMGPEHGYMTPGGRNSEVAPGSVMHQHQQTAMYNDVGSGGIPVTGTGPPPPMNYMQHSQYAPGPYSNPYSQPNPNQAPPQSGHGYPYWAYI